MTHFAYDNRLYLDDEGLEDDHSLHQVRMWQTLLNEKGPFELAHDLELNLICFRYRPPEVAEDELDKLKEEIQQKLMISGKGFVSMAAQCISKPVDNGKRQAGRVHERERLGQ